MRIYGKAAALTVGLVLLVLGGMSPSAFAPPPGPPGPPAPQPQCEVTSVSIRGPSDGTVGESLTFQGEAETEHCSDDPEYTWSLRSAPEGAQSWSTTGQQVSYTPRVAGDYTLKLDVAADETGQGSAEHALTVAAGGSQPGEVQEFALILSSDEQQAFPAMLKVAAGNLRIFLTSLDRALTVVLRREGARAGVATVLVEPGKLTVIELELSSGVYELVPQGADAVLGRIEAR